MCRHKFGKARNEQTKRIGSTRAEAFPRTKIKCLICKPETMVEIDRYPEHYKSCHNKEFIIAGRKVSGSECLWFIVFTHLMRAAERVPAVF